MSVVLAKVLTALAYRRNNELLLLWPTIVVHTMIVISAVFVSEGEVDLIGIRDPLSVGSVCTQRTRKLSIDQIRYVASACVAGSADACYDIIYRGIPYLG